MRCEIPPSDPCDIDMRCAYQRLRSGASGATVSDLNRYMDQVLGNEMAAMIRQYQLDPFPVTPYHTKLRAPGTLSAEMYAVNITGLRHIRRQGDCIRPRSSRPFQATVRCNLVTEGVVVSATSDLTYKSSTKISTYRGIGTRASFSAIPVHVEVTHTLRKPTTVNTTLLSIPRPHLFIKEPKNGHLDSVIQKGYEQELTGLLQVPLSALYLPSIATACRNVPFPH
ncbi:hypothetical protein MTO96_006610 [Rhipicephalus appendiculatus]